MDYKADKVITLPIRFLFGLNCLCRLKQKLLKKKYLIVGSNTLLELIYHNNRVITLAQNKLYTVVTFKKLLLESIPHIMTQYPCSERTKMRFSNLFQIPLYRMLTK